MSAFARGDGHVLVPADLVIGGALADATEDFLLLVTSGIALGAALGAPTVVLFEADPRWDLASDSGRWQACSSDC